jgi:galactokinase
MDVWAPGRVNLIGEHTDYAAGLVLPIAIQLGIRITFERADGLELDAPGGERFAAAIWAELAAFGRPDIGIAGAVASDLPQGVGLGSSGAFEVAVALALCRAADFELDARELVDACRRAEERAAGVPCGILDQAASLLARAGHALFLDCGSFDHRHVLLPDGLAVLVVDSGERRRLESTGYAERRRELEAGVAARVRHVESENERVRAAVESCERDDVAALGPIFAESHRSLRDDYEVSTPALDRLVELALGAGAIGARLTGGGFGGSIVALADRAHAEDSLGEVCDRADVRGWVVQASEGAGRAPGPAP